MIILLTGIITIKNIVLLKERLSTNMKNILKTLILLTAFFMNYANAVSFQVYGGLPTPDYPITMHVVNNSQDSISYDFRWFIQGFNTLDSINGNPVGVVSPGGEAVFRLNYPNFNPPYPFRTIYGNYNNDTFQTSNTDWIYSSPSINGMIIPIRFWDGRGNDEHNQYINFIASDGWVIKSDTKDRNTITNNNGLNIGLDGGGVDNPTLRDMYFSVYPR